MSIIIKGITKAQFYKDTNKIPYMDVGWEVEELPPHGRLIDADAMERFMSETVQGDIRQYPYEDTQWDMAFRMIDSCPTIIEAEEKEE